MSCPVGRLAPSPTGLLHLGHARSFLLAWWSVRSRAGRLVLRMEDLDGERCRPEFADAILRDLEWLGLCWDGPVILQSEQAAAHQAALEKLRRAGLCYPCVCTRREIREAASAPQAPPGAASNSDPGAASAYPGTCRGRFKSGPEAD
ncbi:MAG: glutamate--tRNA ligase family protein, partial [Planctomycetota bacterium]|nr:glutamate--tRNA ligase family protein [Planctomycetota bacterium]